MRQNLTAALWEHIQNMHGATATGQACGISRELAGKIINELPLREILSAAFAVANTSLVGNARAVFSCGIINAKSGRCAEDCAFCAQSSHYKTQSAVYPLVTEDTLLKHAEKLAGSGASYMGIVTSGTAPTDKDLDNICKAAERIKENVDIKLCASLGILDFNKALQLKEAGFSSCHHNLETSRSFYPKICSTHPYEMRLTTVKAAKQAGLRVCSGGIFGLGESWEERFELAQTLRELAVDAVPVNFLTPIAGTPLALNPALPVADALAIIAMLRLMLPEQDIIVCGGREYTFADLQALIFSAGANAMMIGDYLTTKGSSQGLDAALLAIFKK